MMKNDIHVGELLTYGTQVIKAITTVAVGNKQTMSHRMVPGNTGQVSYDTNVSLRPAPGKLEHISRGRYICWLHYARVEVSRVWTLTQSFREGKAGRGR